VSGAVLVLLLLLSRCASGVALPSWGASALDACCGPSATPVSGAVPVPPQCRAHLSHRGGPVACVIRPGGGGGRAQVVGLSVYRVRSAAVRWRRGRGGARLTLCRQDGAVLPWPCAVRGRRRGRRRPPGRGGAGQEGRKPYVIAPLRPLSNSGQTTAVSQSGWAQGHRCD
jgi:hypothetical protein